MSSPLPSHAVLRTAVRTVMLAALSACWVPPHPLADDLEPPRAPAGLTLLAVRADTPPEWATRHEWRGDGSLRAELRMYPVRAPQRIGVIVRTDEDRSRDARDLLFDWPDSAAARTPVVHLGETLHDPFAMTSWSPSGRTATAAPVLGWRAAGGATGAAEYVMRYAVPVRDYVALVRVRWMHDDGDRTRADRIAAAILAPMCPRC
jgi:hypothetical protein